jgi:type I restriction enzyme S subunit
VGKVGFAGIDLYTNEAIAAFMPNIKVSLKFLYYAAPIFLPKYGQHNIYGSLLLNRERIEKARTYVPPVHEQLIITNYLDYEVGRIDELISEKQNFIKLLKEKRQALISHVVTKGTELTGNPDEKYDFIEINSTFDIVPFTKYVVDKSDYRGKTPNKTDSGIFLVTAKNIKMGYINYSASSEYISKDDYEDVMSRGKPKIGDILLTTEAPLGNIALVDDESIALAQRVIRFRVDQSKFDNLYMLRLMTSDFFQNQLNKVATGITAKGIKASKLSGLKVIMPPLDEQKKIVSLIESKIIPINSLISEVSTSIDLLKERRTALISAAVTGKIDLRDKEVA